MGNSKRYKALTAPGQTITLPSLAATAASAAPPGLLWTVWGDDVVLLWDGECGEGESCAGFKGNGKIRGKRVKWINEESRSLGALLGSVWIPEFNKINNYVNSLN